MIQVDGQIELIFKIGWQSHMCIEPLINSLDKPFLHKKSIYFCRFASLKMDEDLYDEFGNYIGPELDDEDEDDEYNNEFPDERTEISTNKNQNTLILRDDSNMAMVAHDENKIVLHEDKRYYPSASEVYPGVRTITLDEDAQDISEPIIKPIKVKSFTVIEKDIPELNYSNEFVAGLMQNPNLIRNIAILGHFHHGKTVFVDTLVMATQEKEFDPHKEIRYTDTRKDERERELSVKSTAISLVLQNLKSKSYLVNILDCPGHINFSDESTAALRAADGAVIIVDAVEGIMLSTERLIKHALLAQVPICLVINKMDRLILELKLPPQDAYFKLMHTIEEANKIISENSGLFMNNSTTSEIDMNSYLLSPSKGNVCFASGQHGWSFSLESFAHIYMQRYPKHDNLDPSELAKRLWGDWYHDPQKRVFTKSKPKGEISRTFVQFVLEPLYKIYAQAIGEAPEDLAIILRKLGIHLKSKEIHLDPKPLLRLILSKYFGYPKGFVEMIAKHVPSPTMNAERKVSQHYTGYQTSPTAQAMRQCDPTGPLMINIVKMFSSTDGSKFYSLGRIYSGTVTQGQMVRVLGEGFTSQDDEDMALADVIGISVSVGRFSIVVSSACAGNWVLLEGVDMAIKKTATITDNNINTDIAIFTPLQFDSQSVIKLAVEPIVPSELPKMIDALRKINKSYPLASTKVEESGEHVIIGTGELYMDCIMHDLRHLYSDIEVKVADPVVSFCETVVESSALRCFSETPNKKNKIAMMAEPLDTGLAADIESGKVNINWDKKTIGEFFRSKYDWDLLSARSVWAFGPDDNGPNLFLNDTIPSEVDKSSLEYVKDSVVQGFRWACREGPLCDEPIRNVKFKLLDAIVASEPIHRGGGQVIPAARRTIYSSFLMAAPRLMEPTYLVELQCPADCIQAVYPVLARRRGHIVQDAPKAGAPFYTVRAYLPVMDSFGFETDIRCYTLGQVFCQQVFDHWSVVPGDPLDRDIVLHLLEPSPPQALARDFMVKTRRRKGLSEVSILLNRSLSWVMT